MLEAVTHHGAGMQRWREKAVTADLRAKDRVELARLREAIARARRAKRARALAARAACRDALVRVREHGRRARAELARKIAEETAAARSSCVSSRDLVRELGVKSVGATKAELERLRADIRLRRRAEGARRVERLTKREARGESDDEVRNNIPRELEPVWARVKSHIKAGPRSSRTEAFLQWVHDNSASVERIINQAVESDIADLVEQEQAMYAQNPRLSMTTTHERRLTFYRNMAKGALTRGDRRKALHWRKKFLTESRHPNPAKRKRRNPYVGGGIIQGNLEPGTMRWNRRGIGNPGKPRRRANPDKAAALAQMSRAGYCGDARSIMRAVDACRAAGCTREESSAAQRHGMAYRAQHNPIRRAPPGNPDRYASARSGWAALAQQYPGALPKRSNPRTRRTRAQLRAIALRHITIAVKTGQSTATIRQVVDRALRYGASRADVEKRLPLRSEHYVSRNPRRRALVKGFSRASIAKNIKRELGRGVRHGQAVAIALSVARKAAKKKGRIPKYLQKKRNPKRSSSPKVGWWRATVYGPGGKVMHRQVARANASTARAGAAKLAKRHGRVALDGPFAAKPAA